MRGATDRVNSIRRECNSTKMFWSKVGRNEPEGIGKVGGKLHIQFYCASLAMLIRSRICGGRFRKRMKWQEMERRKNRGVVTVRPKTRGGFMVPEVVRVPSSPSDSQALNSRVPWAADANVSACVWRYRTLASLTCGMQSVSANMDLNLSSMLMWYRMHMLSCLWASSAAT